MRKFSLFLALAMAISGSSAVAATKTPTAKPTVKTTAKPTVKTSVKPTAKATAKPTANTTSTSTVAPTAKASVKPKPKPKPKPRKKIKVTPSPKAKWPPSGFVFETGIYAKVPTSKELVGVISAKGNLATQVADCKKFVCGAVQVAAEQGCIWWEINSKVYAPNKELLGNLRTIAGLTTTREIKTILLISPEPLESLEYISGIEVVCHQEAKPEGTQTVTFTKVG